MADSILRKFDYQSVCHCSKTVRPGIPNVPVFDYQSVCHCSKTRISAHRLSICLITSQFVTAPKQAATVTALFAGLITSQFVTAPKLYVSSKAPDDGLITSQFVTAPKHLIEYFPLA